MTAGSNSNNMKQPISKTEIKIDRSKIKVNREVIRRFDDNSFCWLSWELCRRHLVTEKEISPIQQCYSAIPKSIFADRNEFFKRYDKAMDDFVANALPHVPDAELAECIFAVLEKHGINDRACSINLDTPNFVYLFHDLLNCEDGAITVKQVEP